MSAAEQLERRLAEALDARAESAEIPANAWDRIVAAVAAEPREADVQLDTNADVSVLSGRRGRFIVAGLAAAAAAVVVIVLANLVSNDPEGLRISPADQPEPTQPEPTQPAPTTIVAATTTVAATTSTSAPPATSAPEVVAFSASDVAVPAEPGFHPVGPSGPPGFTSYAAGVGPNGFVDVISNGDVSRIRRSIDGVNWETTLELENNPFNQRPDIASVGANDLGYVVTGGFGWTYSADGIDWIDVQPLTGLATATDSEFIMIDAANGALTLWRSTTGTDWNGVPTPVAELPRPGLIDRRDPIIEGLATDGSTVVLALGHSGGQEFGYLWSTTDGTTWTEVLETETNDYIYDVIHGPAGWLAYGFDEAPRISFTAIWTSDDLTEWKQVEFASDVVEGQVGPIFGIASNESGYFAFGVGGGDMVAWRSTDGSEWNVGQSGPGGGNLAAVTAFGDSFLLRGSTMNAAGEVMPAGWWLTPG